jgi:hypothetical protein
MTIDTTDPDRIVRLMWRASSRGVYRIALELPASQMDACAEWAYKAQRFSPDVQFRFEERSGRLIRVLDWLKGLVP